MLENEIVSFIFLCAVGSLCYWFFFKCVDWFEKILEEGGEICS